MSSAERLQPQAGIIEYIEEGKALIPHPAELGEERLTGILAESIFLTSSPVRIRSLYGKVIEEINEEEIDRVRSSYDCVEVYYFIEKNVNELSCADEIIIETLEK